MLKPSILAKVQMTKQQNDKTVKANATIKIINQLKVKMGKTVDKKG